MVRELLSREDPVAVLKAVDSSALPMPVLELLTTLGGGGAKAENVDWPAVGVLLREALGWSTYPSAPPSVN